MPRLQEALKVARAELVNQARAITPYLSIEWPAFSPDRKAITWYRNTISIDSEGLFTIVGPDEKWLTVNPSKIWPAEFHKTLLSLHKDCFGKLLDELRKPTEPKYLAAASWYKRCHRILQEISTTQEELQSHVERLENYLFNRLQPGTRKVKWLSRAFPRYLRELASAHPKTTQVFRQWYFRPEIRFCQPSRLNAYIRALPVLDDVRAQLPRAVAAFAMFYQDNGFNGLLSIPKGSNPITHWESSMRNRGVTAEAFSWMIRQNPVLQNYLMGLLVNPGYRHVEDFINAASATSAGIHHKNCRAAFNAWSIFQIDLRCSIDSNSRPLKLFLDRMVCQNWADGEALSKFCSTILSLVEFEGHSKTIQAAIARNLLDLFEATDPIAEIIYWLRGESHRLKAEAKQAQLTTWLTSLGLEAATA